MDHTVLSANRQDLSALVASRLCHDLGNPLGAVSNGVELLEMSGMANSPEMALIAEALRNTEARLRFFRVAYGAARSDQRISEREARDILLQTYGAGRLQLEWRLVGDLPRQRVKCAYLMLSCTDAALPMGGQISIDALDKDGLSVSASGPRILQDLPGLAFLQGRAQIPPTPRDVQFLMLMQEAQDSGAKITVSLSDSAVQIRLHSAAL